VINILETQITNDVKHFVIVGTVSPTNKPPRIVKEELAALKEDIHESDFCKECKENGVRYSIFLTTEDAVLPNEVLEQIKRVVDSTEVKSQGGPETVPNL
jgi:hypothetical protein